jgi:hypothetical protein
VAAQRPGEGEPAAQVGQDFDTYVAIDWSGAEGRYEGIAIARCEPGDGAPRLVAPEAARWTRSAVAGWLDAELKSGRRLLIGLDLAFGMPFEPDIGYAGAAQATDIFALWDAIEVASAAAPDFGCAPVIAHRDFGPLYWRQGKRPRDWRLRQRRSEAACAAATGTRPECVFKLIGAKQVGKASLTGIRVLRDVRARNRDCVAVWPFEPVAGKSALVEIYPTLFRKQAAHGLSKLRTRAELNAALRHFDTRALRGRGELSDHDTDALISAAGMRYMAGDGLPAPADSHIRREGWIFGVPMPGRGQPSATSLASPAGLTRGSMDRRVEPGDDGLGITR